MNETLQTIVLLGAAGGALLLVLRWVWRGFRIIQALANLVEHELKPNSGSSLRDQVDRTHEMLAEHLKEAAGERQRLTTVEDFLITFGYSRPRP